MNVLLIGGSSRMMDAIIDKLNKNGHRLYVLTGRRDKRFSYKHIFERYDFEYEDDSVKDIFESIKPDMVLFLGAYDTNFSWQRARQDSVHYAAALMNILSAYSVVGKGRFVYFSSQEVFSGSYTNNIRETETVAPKGFKAMVVGGMKYPCRRLSAERARFKSTVPGTGCPWWKCGMPSAVPLSLQSLLQVPAENRNTEIEYRSMRITETVFQK